MAQLSRSERDPHCMYLTANPTPQRCILRWSCRLRCPNRVPLVMSAYRSCTFEVFGKVPPTDVVISWITLALLRLLLRLAVCTEIWLTAATIFARRSKVRDSFHNCLSRNLQFPAILASTQAPGCLRLWQSSESVHFLPATSCGQALPNKLQGCFSETAPDRRPKN